jgi:DNA-binding NtrC family response regulator
MTALAKYEWPGNVTELRDAIRHAVAVTQGSPIDVASLPEPLRRRASIRAQV